MPRLFKLTLLTFVLVILASCGFHLRGQTDFPPQLNPLYIDSQQPYGPFERILRQSFSKSNINVVQSANEANATLKIISSTITQSSAAISPNNQILQYNLVLTIAYSILDRQGKVVVTQSVATTKSFTANSNQMLGTNTQQNSIEITMRHDAAFLLTSQLTSTQTRDALNKAYANPVKITQTTTVQPAQAQSATQTH